MSNKIQEVPPKYLVSASKIPAMPARPSQAEATAQSTSIRMPLSFLTGAWIVYEPVASLLGLKGSGSQDEILAVATGTVAAMISNSFDQIRQACNSQKDYNYKVGEGRAKGSLAGFTAGGGAIAADVALTGGIGTAVGLIYLGAGATIGYLMGGNSAKHFSTKDCENGHKERCCDKICKKCGFLFTILEVKWRGVSTANDALSRYSDRLDWYDFVSVLQLRRLNFKEIVAIYEQNWASFDVGTIERGERPTMGTKEFFQWFEKNRDSLSRFRGSDPSLEFWQAAEITVRSDCDPTKPIEIGEINWIRAPT